MLSLKSALGDLTVDKNPPERDDEQGHRLLIRFRIAFANKKLNLKLGAATGVVIQPIQSP